jgi:Zn-dependent metalloprotease
VITHANREGDFLAPTKDHRLNINLNTQPSISATEALAITHALLAPKGPYAGQPTAELVVYPELVDVPRKGVTRKNLNAEDMTRQVLRYTLAYHVNARLENGAEETVHQDFIINAHTGAVIKQWNSLRTADAVGTGNSQYSGVVSINTNSVAGGFEMRDMTRGTAGTFGNNVVTNLNHATSGNGTIFTDADNTWGDGLNYKESPEPTTSANGQTAGVDAHFGIMSTWDYYKLVLGRNGIDGTGKSSYIRVHYSSNYDNAFWDDSCFCMTFGDGSSFTTLTSMDVAGHEMSHGVCATTADLIYSGESGGLNEANSDIHGTMVEFYRTTPGATTVPATGGNWEIGEQLNAQPLRYMYKPSKDGSSPNAWSSGIGSIDVHYSSGPSNRAFFFLSQGSSATSSSDFYSSYLPGGMTGIGNDHAARIAFRALAVYMTTSTNYAQARTAYINSAKDLYGAGSAEEQAVWNAFAAINVGQAWGAPPPPPPVIFAEVEPNDSIAAANAVARTFNTIQGNLTVTTDKDFFGITLTPGETLVIDMTGPAGPDWDLKLFNAAGTQLGISQGSTTSEALTYTNSSSNSQTVYANTYVYSGTNASPYNMALSFSGGTPPPTDTQAPATAASETGTSGTITLSATASDNVGVTKVEFYVDGALKGTDTSSPYSMTMDSTTLTNGSHGLVSKAYDAAGNIGTSATANFSVSNTSTSAPVITTQPADRTVSRGATATFTVVATGTGLNYQWRKSGVNISGATSASYTTPPTTRSDNNKTFSVVVSNSAGSVTSRNARLKVQ